VVGADPVGRAREIVAEVPGVATVTVRAGALRITAGPDAEIDAAWLNTRLVEAGVAVHELRRERASLESVFLDLTGTDPHDRQLAGDDTITEVLHAA
jgi:hypothetical protein